MRRRSPFPFGVSLILALMLGIPVAGDAAEVLWVYPLPNSLVSESPVTVLGYVLGSPQVALKAKVVSADGTAAPQREDLYLFKGKLFSGSLVLKPGRNNVVVGDSVLPLLYRPGSDAEREGEFRRPTPHAGGVENCTPCHGFTQGSLTLKGRVPDLCLRCHEVGTESLRAVTRRNQHTERITPDCLRCHDPHVSFAADLLRTDDNVCVPCHEPRAGSHERAGPQGCTACHDAHASAFPAMLKEEAPALCRGCHQEITDPDRYPRSYHRPVEERECFRCHRPHATQYPSSLAAPVPVLCRDCHDPTDEGIHSGKLEECRSCHTAHLAGQRNLLRDGVSDLCVTCHGEFPEGKSNHPALREGCVSCHNPHAPSRGAVDSEKVCGRCHKLSDEGFRWTHGELVMPKVSQCVFCHAPHRSDYPTLLRGEVHYPLQKGGCKTCHSQEEGSLVLKYQGSKNCMRCHGQITGTSTVVEIDKVHKPVTQVDCIACHNPHLGVRDNLLLEEPQVLCGWCHGIVLRGVENLHGLFQQEGTCYSCHLPHISDFRPLLKLPQSELCTRCHLGVIPEETAERRKLHGVVAQGRCTGCHEPHGSNTENLLADEPDRLCAGCHEEVLQGPEGEPLDYLHGPVGARNCTACHRLGHRHERPDDLFLREHEHRICGLCHETPEAHVPDRFRSKLREVNNRCLACHTPHGADNKFMMRSAF